MTASEKESKSLLDDSEPAAITDHESRPPLANDPNYKPFNGRRLSYAGTFPNSIRERKSFARSNG